MTTEEAVAIFNEAKAAGMKALEAAIPTPMVVVQRENPMDDNSPVVKRYDAILDGMCGFAWVKWFAKGTGGAFIRALKKAGLAGDPNSRCEVRPAYPNGYQFWVHEGNQSFERKRAYAMAFAAVLRKHGIEAFPDSRLD